MIPNELGSPLRIWTRDFLSVCFGNFFLFMTFYMLAVTLPLFATGALHAGEGRVGLVMTSFLVSTVAVRPFAGRWLGRYDRKKLLAGALLLFLACSATYLFVNSFWELLALRFLHGFGFGIAATALAALAAELVPDRRKGEGIGYFSLFMSLAMVVGPALGLAVADRFEGWALFGVCAAMSALAFVCGIALRVPERPAGGSPIGERGWRAYFEPAALPISVAGAILAFSYGSITTFLSVYARDLGLGSYASLFFMVFAAMIVLFRPFTGRWYDAVGPHPLVYGGCLLFAGGMIALSQASTLSLLLGAGMVIGLGFGALLPSYQTLAVQSAPKHRAGLATGTFFVLFDAGYGVGSYALGIVAASAGYHGMYLVAGLVVAATAVVYYTLVHRKMSSGRLIRPEQ